MEANWLYLPSRPIPWLGLASLRGNEVVSAQAQSATVLPFPVPKTRPFRVAVVCDFPEENWHSMDLVGNMLFDQLRQHTTIVTERVRPAMGFSGVCPRKSARLLGRFVQYPRLLSKIVSNFDLFHIVDHSYAHLVHSLPRERVIVTCHDLDAFNCLLQPEREPRSFAFRAMTRRVLSGLQASVHVTCDTAATRDNILEHQLLPAERLSVVHNGVHPSLSSHPDPFADREIAAKIGRAPGSCPELLHVGSTIPRKRIDVLLRVFAEVRDRMPGLRLIRVGTPLTSQQESLAASLGVRKYIDCLERLDTRLLAACYRRASVLLQTSDSEGFGLPVIEALACGTSVIASNIASLREVGGDAADYCSVGNVGEWTNTVLGVLSFDKKEPARYSSAVKQASRFTWVNYADQMLAIYRQVLSA